MVPWREWADRPGYVITTGLINVGSLVAGVALTVTGVGAPAGAALIGWRGLQGVRALNAPDNATPDNAPGRLDTALDKLDLDLPGHRPGTDPTTQDLQDALDGLDTDTGHLHGLSDALDNAAGLDNHPPVPVGGDNTLSIPGAPGDGVSTEGLSRSDRLSGNGSEPDHGYVGGDGDQYNVPLDHSPGGGSEKGPGNYETETGSYSDSDGYDEIEQSGIQESEKGLAAIAMRLPLGIRASFPRNSGCRSTR
ncbi:hypothetical protein [Actinorugispora endophytica]|nr:hypothetical protein [Actinorugispora endophytica]